MGDTLNPFDQFDAASPNAAGSAAFSTAIGQADFTDEKIKAARTEAASNLSMLSANTDLQMEKAVAKPDNPFDQFSADDAVEPPTSATGAFVHQAEGGVVPSLGGAVAAVPGMEAGAAIGATIGSVFPGVGTAIGGTVGGVVGVGVGFFTGYGAVSVAQDAAIHSLPVSTQRAIGQDDLQREAEGKSHPVAQFVGDLAPQALIMGPFAAGKEVVAEGATTFEKIMANPVTARVSGGLFMAGSEAIQEKRAGEPLDPLKIGIATTFGLIFSHPTKLTKAIDAKVSEVIHGAPPITPPVHTPEAIADAKVAGPGVTEEVFHGTEAQSPTTEAAAQTAQAQAAPQPVTPPDVHTVARQLEPELFRQYDTLTQHNETIRNRLENSDAPSAMASPYLEGKLAENQKLLDAMGPEVAATYRRAAESTGTEMVEPAARPVAEADTTAAPPTGYSPEIEAQRDAIMSDVTQRLIKAGRPADEAVASSQIVADHTIARAERFGGALGTPLELHQAEGADIRASKPPKSATAALALAQKTRGKIKITDGVAKPVITLMKSANASTFIHETGHQWLEEMLRDSKHPAAPEGLKTDAATVGKWLGAETLDKVTTRQHEKFARGFEQYMREGVAPSARLASVFSKFKNWLTKIYTTLRGLGSPINDDIKSVFDRMLAAEPRRTVIAAEKAVDTPLSALHEQEAQTTPPQEAEPVRERVVAERDHYIEDLPKPIKVEHAEAETRIDALAKGGSGPSRTGEVDGNRGGPEPVAGSEPSSSAHRNHDTGSGDAGREGAGVSEPDAGRIPKNPNASFGPTESKFVDKAGNIRLDTLTGSDDVKTAIRDAAKANEDFTQERRGVVTDGQVMDLADALGMDFEKLSTRKIGEAFNAEQVIAARQLLLKSATHVSDLMKKAATGADADVLAYAEAKARHQMIQGQVAGLTAEAGRALRAFRDIRGSDELRNIDQFIKQATGRTLFQLKQEAMLGATLETPQQVSKFVKDGQKRTFGRMILEYWINGLISGPATHSTYMIGNLITAFEKAGPETLLAAGIGKTRAMLGREGERVRLGEIGAQVKGAGKAVAPALKGAIEAFRSGSQGSLPGEKPWVPPFQMEGAALFSKQLDENAKFRDVVGSAFGLVQGLRDGLIASAKLLSEGGEKGSPLLGLSYSPLGQIPNIALRGVDVVPLGTAVRLPGRFISGIHTMFRAMNYSMEKSAIAYRTAATEGRAGTDFNARVAELRANPTPEIMEASVSQATELSLMGKGGQLTQALSRLTNAEIFGFPLLKFIDPFVVVSGNIIESGPLKRTPLAYLSPEIRADLFGKNGNIAQDRAQARVLAGSALAITFGGLAAQGYVSGSEPPERNHAMIWRMAGNQAHSVRIGNMWYSVNRLGPIGMLAGMSADLYDIASSTEKGEFIDAAAGLHHAFVQNILDESFARGPSELLQAVTDPARYGQAYVRNFLASFVPYSVGSSQIDRATDPYSRRAKDLISAIKAKVPGLSESLLPNRDIWGEPMPNKTVLGVPGFSAIYTSKLSTDPVNITMLQLGMHPAPADPQIRNVKLSDAQYDDYVRLSGRAAKMQLDKLVVLPDFLHMPDFAKASVITHVIEGSREMARGMVMMKYPEIPKAAYDAKVARVSSVN